jgi:hypothetical protein
MTRFVNIAWGSWGREKKHIAEVAGSSEQDKEGAAFWTALADRFRLLTMSIESAGESVPAFDHDFDNSRSSAYLFGTTHS